MIEYKYYIDVLNNVVRTVPVTKGLGETHLGFQRFSYETKSFDWSEAIDLQGYQETNDPR